MSRLTCSFLTHNVRSTFYGNISLDIATAQLHWGPHQYKRVRKNDNTCKIMVSFAYCIHCFAKYVVILVEFEINI